MIGSSSLSPEFQSSTHSDQNPTSSLSTRSIFLLSDGTGETALQMAQAALVQFPEQRTFFRFHRYSNIRTFSQIEVVLQEAAEKKATVVYTLAALSLRTFFIQKARQFQVSAIDLLGPLLSHFSSYFQHEPEYQTGLLHHLDENYFRRVAAIEYTVAHDDGKGLQDLPQADLVILGVSRTSKTPLSMYLSYQGWKVANIPLVPSLPLPEALAQVDSRRLVGLMIAPEELSRLRQARLSQLMISSYSPVYSKLEKEYANIKSIVIEMDWALSLLTQRKKALILDVTGRALEETAAEILQEMERRGLAPQGGPSCFGNRL